MRARCLAGLLWLCGLSACGGAATHAPPEDEVSATWTAGDDAPLEAAPDEEP